MNTSRKILLILTTISILAILGFIVFNEIPISLTTLDLVIFGLIIIIGAFAITTEIKKSREEKEGYPLEDELSDHIKYKAGYYSFQASMYIWIFILIFRTKFPDFETAIGGGILLSAAVSFIIKYLIEKRLNEK